MVDVLNQAGLPCNHWQSLVVSVPEIRLQTEIGMSLLLSDYDLARSSKFSCMNPLWLLSASKSLVWPAVPVFVTVWCDF